MNQNPLREITQKIAGHIRRPMAAHEIAKQLTDGDYSAELIMQHLLRYVDFMADRGEIILSEGGSCDSLENGDVLADMRTLYGDFLRALSHTLAEYEAPAGTLEKITAQ